MRNKIIITIALLLLLLDFSSCTMRGVKVSNGSYFQPTHTRHHWGRERHQNTRHMYWGKHKYGMRPYSHRGQFRY